MKNLEFYVKFKTSYQPPVNTLFSSKTWWRIALIIIGALLIEPIVIYRQQRYAPLSVGYYLRLVQYSVLIVVPLMAIFLWSNWRELVKRKRGYSWVGKFEVISKQSFLFCYLMLMPGNTKLKVNRSLFDKTRVGDYVLIRRDSLGALEEVKKVSKFSGKLLAKARGKRFAKNHRNFFDPQAGKPTRNKS